MLIPHKAGGGVLAAVDLMFLLHLWPHTRDMKGANCKLRRQLKKCSPSVSRIVIQLEATAEMVASCQPHCSRLGLRRCLQRSRRGIVDVFSSFLAGGACTHGSIVDKPLEVNLYRKRRGQSLDLLHRLRDLSLVVSFPEMNAFVANVEEHMNNK
jgi:hypothetical protein